MERVGRKLKKQSFRKIIIYFLTCCMVFNTSLPAVMATPSGGEFKVGDGTIVQNVVGGNNTVLVNQIESVIEWGGLANGGWGGIDTSALESLSFSQGELNNSAVLNRIMSGNITQFNGALNGEGMRIFIVNPAGIIFGEGSTVNVSQLVASGLNMSNDAFHNVLSDVSNKMVFPDGSGNVINNGTINATDSAYLIGRNVTNNGSILCPGGLVVMAAGDAIQLGQPGSSVIVTLADITANSDNDVTNNGEIGNSEQRADTVVLAAGDVWSTAISSVQTRTMVAKAKNNASIGGEISAYDNASSDAVATIDIEAGNDITIVEDADIIAQAEGDGTYNAIASVTMKAVGGNVTAINEVDEDNDTIIRAHADYGLTNLADVRIEAGGDVELQTVEDNVRVQAFAGPEPEDGDGREVYAVLNRATIDIDAANFIERSSNNDVEVIANASMANENKADVKITVEGNVTLEAGEQEAKIYAFAHDGTTNTANITVDAPGKVEILSDSYSEEGYNRAEMSAEAWYGENNSANTTITAGSVDVISNENGGASIWSSAYDGVTNKANLTITTNGTGEEGSETGDVKVISNSIEGPGWAEIGAEALSAENSNDADVSINATGDVGVDAYNGGQSRIGAYANVDDESNTANVKITAGGDIDVRAEDGSNAQISAEASYGYDNTAGVDITAQNGNVDVYAYDNAYAEIGAYATGAENNNTADVTVTAKRENPENSDAGHVNVEAQDITYHNNSRAEIYSETYDAGMNNTSTTTINADGDVTVNATNTDQEVGIGAYAGLDDESNTANVIVTAGGNVELTAHYSNAYIEADALYGVNNTAGVDVTANGGRVALSSYQNSNAWIDAGAREGTDNTSTVTVTTKGQSGLDDDNGDVRLDTAYSSMAWIEAVAENAENNNSATTTINASENVWMSAYDNSTAGIESSANNANENNTANIIVTAGGNVDVRAEYNNSSADIYAKASDGITNNAGVDITAGADVRAQAYGNGSYSFAGIEAEVYAEDGTNTATTTVNAGGKVVARADSGGEVDIDSEAWYGSTNKATTTITAGDYVKVKAVGYDSDAAIEAEALYSYNNTANVDIKVTGEAESSYSGMVRVIAEDGGQAEIEALAWNDGDVDDYTDLTAVEGDYIGLEGTIQGITNTAKVDIEAKSVEVSADGGNSSAFISSNAGNEIRLDLDDYEGDLYLTLGSISNDADILIATIPDDDGDMEDPVADNGDVLVVAGNSGIAGLDVEASNKINAEDDYLYVDLTVQGPVENSSDISINAGDDVMAIAQGEGYSDVEIDTEAWNEITGSYANSNIYLVENGPVQNVSGVDITAGDDVTVKSEYGFSRIGANAWNESQVLPEIFPDTKDNIATVNINAGGGVGVLAEYGSEAHIGAEAEFATTNTADVAIDAVGLVEVESIDGSIANVKALTKYAVTSNTSDVEVNAKEIMVSAEGGEEFGTGSFSRIISEAFSAYDEENSENTANVAVYTHATNEAGGDVLIKATMGSGASIESDTKNAKANTSDVLVCADGNIRIEGMMGFADILADAVDAYSNNSSNTSKVRVGSRGDVGVELISGNGRARIESYAGNGYANTAETVVFSKGGVLIVDKESDGEESGAEIVAKALDGYHTNAYVGICAQDDVMVMAGISPEDFGGEVIEGVGSHAIIGADASSYSDGDGTQEPSTANAKVTVVSHNGGVAVIDSANTRIQESRTAEIISSASGGKTNTSYTGVAAGGDLLDAENPLYELTEGTGVLVLGIGDLSHAAILSETSGDYVNTSNTVVCTPSEVVVETEDAFGRAEIGASAEGDGINTATTQVYAGDVYVYNANLYGEGGIWANAQGWPFVPFLGDQEFILSEYDGEYGYHDLVWIEGGGLEDDDIATLMIRDYSLRQDCPECPPGPCDEPIEPKPEPKPEPRPEPKRPFVPAAPLPERLSFEVSGYPALMSWVAKELGIGAGSIQIGVTNSLTSPKEIQPYRRLARLRAAATILQDDGGAYINALAQVIYEFASSTTPPTEEQMASIADAMSRNTGANNQYALAGKYLDTLAEYVGILSDEMGYTKEQAVQMATEKYVNRLAESDNAAVAAYIAARLAAMGG